MGQGTSERIQTATDHPARRDTIVSMAAIAREPGRAPGGDDAACSAASQGLTRRRPGCGAADVSGAAARARPAVGDGGRAPQDSLSAATDQAGKTARAGSRARAALGSCLGRARRPAASVDLPAGDDADAATPRAATPTRAAPTPPGPGAHDRQSWRPAVAPGPGTMDLLGRRAGAIAATIGATVGGCVTGVVQGPIRGVQACIENLEEDDDEDLPAPIRGVYMGCGACIGLLCLPWVKAEDRGREAFLRRWPRPPAPARR